MPYADKDIAGMRPAVHVKVLARTGKGSTGGTKCKVKDREGDQGKPWVFDHW